MEIRQDYAFLTHQSPDLDALVTFWLRRFGVDKYPGIENSQLLTTANGNDAAAIAKEVLALEERGRRVCVVDIGGGEFDHHPHSSKPGECAATLFAKHLEVDEDPALESILRYVFIADTKGGDHPMALASLIKQRHQAGVDLEDVVCWAEKVLDDLYANQENFWKLVTEKFFQVSKIQEIPFGDRIIKVVVAHSDDPQIAQVARSVKVGVDAALVVIKNSNGHIQIINNRRHGIELREVIRLLRLAELKKKNARVTDWKYLEGEGMIPEVPEWFYFAECIYNGSHTHPDTPVTKLSLSAVMDCIRLALDYQKLQVSCPKISCYRQCPWYQQGLLRCRKIRYQEKTSQAVRS